MSNHGEKNADERISKPFRQRLAKLGAGDRVRAVVMLNVQPPTAGAGQRQSALERRSAVAAAKQAASEAMDTVDGILSHHDGRRMSDQPNALGYVAVETTRDGVLALANCDRVKAVLEDQPISPLRAR